MSETLLTVSNPYEPARRKPGTIGFAVPGCEAQVVDEAGHLVEPGEVGELWVRGPSLMTEYWGQPEATQQVFAEGGWLMTGDAARHDEEGYLVHVGRRSVDILKVGGYKISAREIEEVLESHPGVVEVAVLGAPDEEWGERVVAAVVASLDAPWPAHDASACQRELEAWARARLASFKAPRQVILLDALPRNALGKIQKQRIVLE